MAEMGADRLEVALADLTTRVVFPATPDLASAVRPHLRQQTPWWLGSARRSLVLAVAGLLLVAGAVGAIGIGIGAIQIRFGEPSASPFPLDEAADRGFGREVTLDEAAAAVPFDLRLPDLPALGAPDHVFLAPQPAGGTVALAWGGRAGFPADEHGLGLVVTQFAAAIGPDSFSKMVVEGATVQPVAVDGRAGWWVSGGDHFFFYLDGDGRLVQTSVRLVSSALFWEADGVVYRVEGAPDLDAARSVAGSL